MSGNLDIGKSAKPSSERIVRAYFDAGARLNAGQPLYPADADVNASTFYRYPPLLAIAFRPLAALLPFEAAAWLWEAITLGAFALTLRIVAPRPGFLRAMGILAFPIAWSLALGQAQVVVTWLTALASPFAVALAGQLKLFPALVAVYFLGIRDWRWLRRFAGWSLALIVVQVLLEPRGVVDFLDVGLADSRFYTFNVADSFVTVGAVLLACILLRQTGIWYIPVYIVLGVLYESFFQPITILSTLPSAGLGALADAACQQQAASGGGLQADLFPIRIAGAVVADDEP